MKSGFVYIFTNRPRGTLYIGVTSNPDGRFNLHSITRNSFAGKYRLQRLVHFEEFATIDEAIAREKQLKNWRRQWKLELIETTNPNWSNLLDSESSSE